MDRGKHYLYAVVAAGEARLYPSLGIERKDVYTDRWRPGGRRRQRRGQFQDPAGTREPDGPPGGDQASDG